MSVAAAVKVHFFYDLKSPYVLLAWNRTRELAKKVPVVYTPYALDIESLVGSPRARSSSQLAKAKYFYHDARRSAPPGVYIRGPARVYDSRIALLGSVYAKQHSDDAFHGYSEELMKRFFARGTSPVGIEIDNPQHINRLLSEFNVPSGFLSYYLSEEALDTMQEANNKAEEMGVFGVPMYVVEREGKAPEPYFGQNRLPDIEKLVL